MSPVEGQLLDVLENGVLTITLNRPERRNALSESLLTELGELLIRVENTPSIRCVVLKAAGPVFCSGHDLGEMQGRSEAEYSRLFSRCSDVMQQLRRIPQPVIARVHALATAAGCQLVAACDMVVAATEARFATPGVKIGLFCTTPMVPLVRSIPPKVALEMLMTGQPISAQRAYEIGLVNHVVSAEQLDEKILELTEAISATSAYVIRLGKQAFYQQLAQSEVDAYFSATAIMTMNAVSHDAQEGIAAFLQKWLPNWKHE